MKHPNQQLLDMIESKKTVSEICAALGYGRTTIYRWMRKLGTQPPRVSSPKGWKKYDWKAVQIAYNNGKSKIECLEAFGLRPDLWTRAANEGRLLLRQEDIHTSNMDLTGQKFEDWTILSKAQGPADGNRYWLCQCVCGKKVVKTSTQVKFDSKSCGCRRMRNGNEAPLWKGYGEISLSYWGSIVRASKIRSKDIPFEITIEDGWNLFIKQGRKCAISGVDITFGPYSHRAKNTASLDRIDSSKGYTLDNVQWVHKDVNIMKLDHTMANFVNWINTIYNHQNSLFHE